MTMTTTKRTIHSLFKNILLSDIDIDIDHKSYRKLLMTNLGFLFAFGVLSVFSVVNFFIKHNVTAGLLEALFIIPVVYGFLNLRKEQNIEKSARFVSYLLFIMILSVILLFRFHNCIGAWGLLFPFVAMSLRGPKKGIILVTVFNVAAYSGALYFWLQGDITLMTFIRFVNVSLFITILVYLYEQSITLSYRKQAILNESLKRSIRKAEKLAVTDALTGLFNQRHFDTVYRAEFNRAKRAHKPFHFAILDIDNFKRYNDTYGHEAGNHALQQVAHVLQFQTVRSGDYAFRIGGEEFAIIRQSGSRESFDTYLENIREKIEEEKILHSANPPWHIVTISIGAVTVTEYDTASLTSVYNAADKNLYRVKRSGRNGVVHTECNRSTCKSV